MKGEVAVIMVSWASGEGWRAAVDVGDAELDAAALDATALDAVLDATVFDAVDTVDLPSQL